MKLGNYCVVLSEMNLQTDDAAIYANDLLKTLGEHERIQARSEHPAIAWQKSGLQDITGAMLPLPLCAHANGVMMALNAISAHAENLSFSGAQLLGERALRLGFACKGRQSASGFARLLDTQDGRIALNLVRDEDWDLIPAWLEAPISDWTGIEMTVKTHKAIPLMKRAAEMGLAAAVDHLPPRRETWFAAQFFEKNDVPKNDPNFTPLIVDLSSLWAGPLASSLLGSTGAKVVKVESPNRPDGMRDGDQGFYGIINAGKDCVALDFRNRDDLERLTKLLDRADVVIEASRPRALEQIGIDAEATIRKKPGKIWARLSAYGRSENRIGFGDDIGISAGLATVTEQAYGTARFVGDAIADPISGLHLALAIRANLNQGGGALLDFSMTDVLRYAMGEMPVDFEAVAKDWQAIADQYTGSSHPARLTEGMVKALGADNKRWLC